MICPHCSQWNPSGRPRCVFCQNELAPGAMDRTSQPPSSYAAGGMPQGTMPPAAGPATPDFEKEPGSPAEIAKTLRTTSIIAGAALVAIFLMWTMCPAP